jgi:hypothetical protein
MDERLSSCHNAPMREFQNAIIGGESGDYVFTDYVCTICGKTAEDLVEDASQDNHS